MVVVHEFNAIVLLTFLNTTTVSLVTDCSFMMSASVTSPNGRSSLASAAASNALAASDFKSYMNNQIKNTLKF